MGKQRTDFFKTCIILFSMLMVIVSGAICFISIITIIESGQGSEMIVLAIAKIVLANIIIIIVLYFFWSVLKTLEELRDNKHNIEE